MIEYLVCLPSLDASQRSEWQGWPWPTVASAPPAVSEEKQHIVLCIHLCLPGLKALLVYFIALKLLQMLMLDLKSGNR